jgi:quinol monooxygenase YgiN
MIYVVATVDVKPENREAFAAGAKACIAETVKEKGCISYDCHTSVTAPNRFVFVERWESQAALDAHGQAPHLKAWRELSNPMKVSPTVIEIVTPANIVKR